MKIHLVVTTALVGLTLCMTPVFAQSTAKEQASAVEQEAASEHSTDKTPEQLAKEADIRKLLIVTGAGKMGVQMMQQMFDSVKRQNPGVPAEYFDRFMEEVDPNELVEISIPSYDNHLTHDEIKELLKFYESPIGKKLIEKQPLIMQDAMVAGQKWGLQLHSRLQEKLKSDF